MKHLRVLLVVDLWKEMGDNGFSIFFSDYLPILLRITLKLDDLGCDVNVDIDIL